MSEPVHEIEVEIRNVEGLHMRPAMQFVDTASRFECDIQVANDDTLVDAKSIMQMTMLAAICGTRLRIIARGRDAAAAIAALRDLVEVKMFGETPATQGNADRSER
ncbi:MAG TPA: HPr family phosphocarrier protein [Anaerohalosphaeraceae bacterium]|nr:HPr family phosphocarrier protein [Anaerohalosphaeraceae bacterium]HRT50864.1 HPr family phosphocarrier protein [Anaerohalosphaeraceae bacterium]HRT86698.1 HPr family phosphocarrier protein [Anaerohalosphaeraceae bacterium]